MTGPYPTPDNRATLGDGEITERQYGGAAPAHLGPNRPRLNIVDGSDRRCRALIRELPDGTDRTKVSCADIHGEG
jgi:hypothetical protein